MIKHLACGGHQTTADLVVRMMGAGFRMAAALAGRDILQRYCHAADRVLDLPLRGSGDGRWITPADGIELAAYYTTRTGIGQIDWSLTGNYNQTKITRDRVDTEFLDDQIRGYIETASPRYKISAGALLTHGRFTVNLRETVYGPTSTYLTPDAENYYKSRIGVAGITDLELAYRPLQKLELAVGASNLFNKLPAAVPLNPDGTSLISGGNVYGTPNTDSPYGYNGGYYYGRATLNF